MSRDDHTDRDATPDIPNLPAPSTVVRGHRPRRVPAGGTAPATAHDLALQAGISPEPAGRMARETRRRSR